MINQHSHLNKADWQFSNTPSSWLKYPWPRCITLLSKDLIKCHSSLFITCQRQIREQILMMGHALKELWPKIPKSARAIHAHADVRVCKLGWSDTREWKTNGRGCGRKRLPGNILPFCLFLKKQQIGISSDSRGAFELVRNRWNNSFPTRQWC